MQKTAYEMRISDWSSDVCSSDLVDAHQGTLRLHGPASATRAVSTAGYSAVSVAFTMSAGSLENGEFCHAEISTDGGASWTAVLTLGNGQDNGSPHTASASPAGIKSEERRGGEEGGDTGRI